MSQAVKEDRIPTGSEPVKAIPKAGVDGHTMRARKKRQVLWRGKAPQDREDVEETRMGRQKEGGRREKSMGGGEGCILSATRNGEKSRGEEFL